MLKPILHVKVGNAQWPLYCTIDDISPSGSTSLQPLDISIDISHSALTLKGVTFHLHTMLIKIHPYRLKKKGA